MRLQNPTLFTILLLTLPFNMSNYEEDHACEISLGPNVPDDLWETHASFLRHNTTEPIFYTHANNDSYNELNDLFPQQDVVMENVSSEFEVCQDSSRVPSTAELHRGKYDCGSNDM
jgi:hypothetical protein